MKPVNTIATTLVLNAPPDWDAKKLGPCEALPICESGRTMFSYWQPNAEELAQLNAGMPVRLGILGSVRDGRGHPIVSLDVEV